MSVTRALLALVISAAAAGLPAQPQSAHPQVDLRGRLYRSVFQGSPPYLSPGDIASAPEDLRKRLSEFMVRRASFTSKLEGKAADIDAAMIEGRKRAVERAIVAVVDHPDAPRLALAFVRDAPLAHDWAGKPAAPLAEADFAEAFLKRDASSPLAPFLYVFIAHRQRGVFETSARAEDTQGQAAAAKKYRAFIQRARSAPDPLYGLIADDMDRQRYVYLQTEAHPREYNPGG